MQELVTQIQTHPELQELVTQIQTHPELQLLKANLGTGRKGNRIIVPKSLQRRVIELAHQGHQGIVKTKSLIRSKVLFVGIDKAVEDSLRNCGICQADSGSTVFAPLIPSKMPDGPSKPRIEVGARVLLKTEQKRKSNPIWDQCHLELQALKGAYYSDPPAFSACLSLNMLKLYQDIREQVAQGEIIQRETILSPASQPSPPNNPAQQTSLRSLNQAPDQPRIDEQPELPQSQRMQAFSQVGRQRKAEASRRSVSSENKSTASQKESNQS
ncbi:unnamed protein product [Brachionus calyciflorus]|uniref:Integrase zinc-binding domain-containing protein n=1 Tax=Brachionus calyciflorus TaxID=104777 RepID=A0A813ZZN0_9BILA|nr:unnamed protein product [Brachionus calyciflorus]